MRAGRRSRMAPATCAPLAARNGAKATAPAALALVTRAAAKATAPAALALVTRAAAAIVSAAIVALTAAALPAAAQDFLPPAAAPGFGSPAAYLERGLPPAAGGLAIEGVTTRWHGLPELTTRAAALGLSLRSLRVAAGVSQTGLSELGWNAAGLALGAAGASAGAALRAVARRDCAPQSPAGAFGAGVGAEAGGGAWVEAGPGLVLWAAAPQLWTRGNAPPLARGLEIGGAWRADGLALWLSRGSLPRGASPAGEHEAGVALAYGPLGLWCSVRDRPLRGSVGVRARALRLAVGAEVECHPVLGETVRLGIGLAAGGGAR